MNIIEALKHFQEGMKIKSNDSKQILRILDSSFVIYQFNETENYYELYEVEQFVFSVNNLNNWIIVADPTPTSLFSNYSRGAIYYYKKGYTIKRLKTSETFNNTNLADKKFSFEDIEANDWEVIE
jgi:hypothetical protein